VIGSDDRPSRFANFLHSALNRLPVDNNKSIQCEGDLKGFRMYTEWHRYRSLVYGSWEPKVSAVVRETVREGMTALDIGGHIGYYTLLLARYAGKNGRVYAFEPLPSNFELLEKNIWLNNLDQVEALPFAVFSHPGKLTISAPDGDSNSGGASVVSVVGSRQIEVEATTIDSFCKIRGIRPEFIKMDVEGAEYDVLQGAEETIRACRPKMLIELHHFDGNVAANPGASSPGAMGIPAGLD